MKKTLKKEKFVLLDSNIYIHLCFVDLEIENIDVLEKLKRLLNSKKFILLLPEVIELEFEKRFKEKIDLVKEEMDGLIEKIQTSKTIGSKKAKKNLTDAVKKSKGSTLKEIIAIKRSIDDIFNNDETIRKGLELKPETLVDGYKMFLRCEKPYKKPDDKKNYENIQPDSLIIASVANYLKSKSNYELYFSTGNTEDFCENPKNKSNLKLAPNIIKQFKHIEYSYDTLKMLNKNFAAGYDKKTIKVMAQTSVSSINIDVGSYLQNSLLHAGSLVADPSIINAISVGPTIKSLTYNLTNKTCIRCGKPYYFPATSVLIDDGLCDSCKLNPSGFEYKLHF